MARPRSGSHLRKRGNIYWYRRVVPADARSAFQGVSEVTFSLETMSEVEAKRLEKQHDVAFEARLKAARESRDPKSVAARMAKASPMKISMTHNWDGLTDHLSLGQMVTASSIANAKHLRPRYRLVKQFDDLLAPLTGGQINEVGGMLLSVMQTHIARMTATPVVITTDAGFTLEWAYERWLRAEPADASIGLARRHFDAFLKFTKLLLLDQVRRHHVEIWRDSLKDSGLYAANSINQRLQLVSAILRAGWRSAEMPAPDLSGLILPVGDNDRGAWQRDEIRKALLALEPGSWAAWVFLLGLTTSVRIGEPLAARVGWLDQERSIIEVERWATKGSRERKKLHCMPLISILREPMSRYVAGRSAGEFLFADAPRSANPKLGAGHEASKWFGRFFAKHQIDRVFHELRDTWIEEARHSPVERDIWEIISGHSAATVSDRYGGKKPRVLIDANDEICRFVTADPGMRAAVVRLAA